MTQLLKISTMNTGLHFYLGNKTSKTKSPSVILALKLLDIEINDDKIEFLLKLKT